MQANRGPVVLEVKSDFKRSTSETQFSGRLTDIQLFDGLTDIPWMHISRLVRKTETYQKEGFAWGYLLAEGTKVNDVDMEGYFVIREAMAGLEALTKLVRDRTHDREPIDRFRDEKEHTRKVQITSTDLRLTVGFYEARFRGAHISITGSLEHEEAPLIIAKRVLEVPQIAIESTDVHSGMTWKP